MNLHDILFQGDLWKLSFYDAEDDYDFYLIQATIDEAYQVRDRLLELAEQAGLSEIFLHRLTEQDFHTPDRTIQYINDRWDWLDDIPEDNP